MTQNPYQQVPEASSLAGQAGGFAPAALAQSFAVVFGTGKQPHRILPNAYEGSFEIADGQIVFRGKSQSAARTGAAAFGLVGAIVGHLISKGSKEQVWTADCSQTRCLADSRRRMISVELCPGLWATARPKTNARQAFPMMQQSLSASVANGVQESQLGGMGALARVALILGISVVAAVIITILVAVAAGS